jgi:hypothetical protein
MAVPDSKKIAFKVFFIDIEIVKFLLEAIETILSSYGKNCEPKESN